MFAAVEDVVCGGDDGAFFVLAEDGLQASNRKLVTVDKILEHIACTDRGELIDVAHEYDVGFLWNGAKQGGGETYVEHARFVDDDKFSIEWVGLVVDEATFLRLEFEHAVNCLGIAPCGFAHALGCPASGCRELDLYFFGSQDLDQCSQDRGLSCAGTTGDD